MITQALPTLSPSSCLLTNRESSLFSPVWLHIPPLRGNYELHTHQWQSPDLLASSTLNNKIYILKNLPESTHEFQEFSKANQLFPCHFQRTVSVHQAKWWYLGWNSVDSHGRRRGSMPKRGSPDALVGPRRLRDHCVSKISTIWGVGVFRKVAPDALLIARHSRKLKHN